jgi:acyl-CoA reductase-like NAD-dependent aldehyde dehydrogenase
MAKEEQNTGSIPVLPDVPYPSEIGNWIDNKECKAASGDSFSKLSPATGEALFQVARSGKADVNTAVESAKRAQVEWAQATPVRRGDVLRATALIFRDSARELAKIVALETGKSVKDALGEVGAAV